MNIPKIFNTQKGNSKKFQYLLFLFAFGILLMLYPTFQNTDQSPQAQPEEHADFSIEKEEARLSEILSAIDGVGTCKVLLSVHSGAETVLAEDDGETVVISSSGKQATVPVQTKYPEFHGAIIVSGGCDNANVRYDILSSVMAYTGLGVDRITICPIQE